MAAIFELSLLKFRVERSESAGGLPMFRIVERIEADLLNKVRDSSVLRAGETPRAAVTAWTDGRGPTMSGAAVAGGVLGGAIGGAIGAVIGEERRMRKEANPSAPRMLVLVLTDQRLRLFKTLRRRKTELHGEVPVGDIANVSSEP
jgi:hypothetical protein